MLSIFLLCRTKQNEITTNDLVRYTDYNYFGIIIFHTDEIISLIHLQKDVKMILSLPFQKLDEYDDISGK